MAKKSAANDPGVIDDARRKIGAAALELLNDHPLAALDLADIGVAAKVEEGLVRRLFPHPAAAVEKGITDLDESVMLSLADDFADDPEASHHDKILEGLIARYEAWRPYRKAIDHLNKASLRDPILGAILVMRLNQASERLLTIAGVDLAGINGMLRIKGLSGIALSCQREWMRDDSADMATTIRSLDQRLRQAEELAATLRIITPQSEGSTEDDRQF